MVLMFGDVSGIEAAAFSDHNPASDRTGIVLASQYRE
jgi:hypothetical protein